MEVAQNLLTAKEVELANTKAELLQYKQRSEDLASKVRARACAPKEFRSVRFFSFLFLFL